MNINNKSSDYLKLKDRLCELKKKKGIASRNIGNAKSKKEPFDEFLEEVQTYSLEIRNIKDDINNLNKAKSVQVINQDNIISLPAQFKPVYYTDFKYNIIINRSPDMNKWDSYVNSNNNSTAYHHSSIKSVIEKTFYLKCHYLSAEDEENNIHGILPLVELKSKLFGNFFVSLPFFNYGGVLADTDEIKQKLLTSAKELSKLLGVSHIEYRHCYTDNKMPTRADKITMLLNLPDTEEQLWHKIGSKLRAQIKKSEKYGAKIVIGRQELVDDFYKVFAHNMRDLGTPVYSKRFFINMLKFNLKSNIAVVYIDSRPVSAGFILGWRNTLEIPWASTLRCANKYSTNMILYWEIIRFAIGEGYQVFDFGRCSKGSNTHRFKKQWGAKEQSLYWHYCLSDGNDVPKINPENSKYKLLIRGWKILPVFIANFIGPFIIRNLP
jgi:FemAB-related protein (PEP-CTERM system-associated)